MRGACALRGKAHLRRGSLGRVLPRFCSTIIPRLRERCKSSFYITHTIIIWSLSLLRGYFVEACCGFSTNHCLLQLIFSPQNCTRFDLRVTKIPKFFQGSMPPDPPRTRTLHDNSFYATYGLTTIKMLPTAMLLVATTIAMSRTPMLFGYHHGANCKHNSLQCFTRKLLLFH